MVSGMCLVPPRHQLLIVTHLTGMIAVWDLKTGTAAFFYYVTILYHFRNIFARQVRADNLPPADEQASLRAHMRREAVRRNERRGAGDRLEYLLPGRLAWRSY